jgi:hypothetical protein
VSTLGINTHLDYTVGAYSNTAVAISAINYLGVKNLRDCPLSARAMPIWDTVADATGAKFITYMPRSSPAQMQQSLDYTPQLAAMGVLNYIEGANEPETPYPLSLGNSLAYSAYFQQKVYAMGKQYGLQVINLSVGAGWTAADGWQGNYDSIGDLSAYTDYANAHTYPAVSTNMPYKTINNLNGLAKLGAVSRPVITTEMGWNIASVNPDVVAAHLLNGIMDSAYLGDVKTYVFALFDDGSGKWGIMNDDGTPRPAGTALHNLTTILADNGSTFTAPQVTYTLAGTKGTEKTIAIAKSDGSRWLAIWDEVSAAHALTLTLPTTAQTVQVYTPKTSASPVQTASNVTSVSINLGSGPTLVKFVPAPPPPPPPPTQTVINSSASNTTITADYTTTTMNLSGKGNTINAGAATTLIQAFAGTNTFNLSSATAKVYVANSGNKINVGSGVTSIYDGGTNNTFAFSTIGGGQTDIYGYIFDRGSKLDLKQLLAHTEWDGTTATLNKFLKVSISGVTANVSVTPSGTVGGLSYNVIALHDHPKMTLTTLIANSILK